MLQVDASIRYSEMTILADMEVSDIEGEQAGSEVIWARHGSWKGKGQGKEFSMNGELSRDEIEARLLGIPLRRIAIDPWRPDDSGLARIEGLRRGYVPLLRRMGDPHSDDERARFLRKREL